MKRGDIMNELQLELEVTNAYLRRTVKRLKIAIVVMGAVIVALIYMIVRWYQ